MKPAPFPRDLLLELVAGPQADVGQRIERVSPQDWNWIGSVAMEHRLGPLLAHRFSELSVDVPAEFGAACRRALTIGSLRWLRQLRALHLSAALLDAAGVRHVALKGAWLAFAAYPDGATRPMRDLDLLVEDVPAADRALREAGFMRLAHLGAPDRPATGENHTSSLRAPGGELIELHHRIDAMWRGSAAFDESSLLTNAHVVETPHGRLRFPSPEDNLLHLIGHGALHHRFDNGPLLLSDVALLCSAVPIDWARHRRRAEASGLGRASDLVFAMLHELRGTDGTADPPPLLSEAPPEEVIAQAKDLLVLDRAEAWARLRYVDAALQTGRVGGARFILGRAAPSRSALAQMANRSRSDWRIWLQAPHWYFDRGRRFLGTRMNGAKRKAMEADLQVEFWLRGD